MYIKIRAGRTSEKNMWGFGAAWLNGLQNSFSEDYLNCPLPQIPHSHSLMSSCPHQISENFYLDMQPFVTSYFQCVYFCLFQNILRNQKVKPYFISPSAPWGSFPLLASKWRVIPLTGCWSEGMALNVAGTVPFCAWLVDIHGPMTCRFSNLEGGGDCRVYRVFIICHLTG